mmetsp:Transcript_44430/g.103691  ORF Transcript_44430/g.103691 Transcript_44430/m.103691 type:complete len:242 (-) Transcript_44430:178-903(-)
MALLPSIIPWYPVYQSTSRLAVTRALNMPPDGFSTLPETSLHVIEGRVLQVGTFSRQACELRRQQVPQTDSGALALSRPHLGHLLVDPCHTQPVKLRTVLAHRARQILPQVGVQSVQHVIAPRDSSRTSESDEEADCHHQGRCSKRNDKERPPLTSTSNWPERKVATLTFAAVGILAVSARLASGFVVVRDGTFITGVALSDNMSTFPVLPRLAGFALQAEVQRNKGPRTTVCLLESCEIP